MRKYIAFFIALMMLTLCLTACQQELKVDDPTMLELPGIKWGATPEKVKKALKVTEDQIFAESDQGTRYAIGLNNIPFFDELASSTLFFFSRATDDGEYKLSSVYLFYPDETDMTVVRDHLIGIYGPGTGILGVTKYPMYQNSVQPEIDSILTLSPRNGQGAMANWWASTAKGTDVFTAEEIKRVVAVYNAYSADIVLEHLEKEPLVTMVCTDSAPATLYGDYGKNCVYFSAHHYISTLNTAERYNN